MKLKDINVGDVLYVRKWDDMVNEFDVDYYGDINCEFMFSSGMRYLCGEELTVRHIENRRISAEEDIFATWVISADMLERRERIPDIEEREFLEIIRV